MIFSEDELMEQVAENLNKYKRVDGGEYPKANEELYKIFNKEVLARLGKKYGLKLPPDWGYIQDGDQYGGWNNNQPVVWGLRKAVDYREFLDVRSPTSKKIRTKTGNIYRPQIVFTSDPVSFIEDLDDETYCCKAGKGWKPETSKVKKHPLWDSIRLIPLMLYLPILGHKGGRNNVINTLHSRVAGIASESSISSDDEIQEMLENKISGVFSDPRWSTF